ncbi:MAG: coenzyme F420-0:L-glutamate ligase [Acidobacteria bacterium]|nr:MAG: coenzyme F420-0:L-glutamate ligase [Acidobacteriota bacterium]
MDAPEIRLIPVYLEDEILPGDGLLQKLNAALRHQKIALAGNDVIVIKHKIISKAEGRVVRLESVRPRKSAVSWGRRYHVDARVIELSLRESKRIVRQKNGVLITETHYGFVCANSGVDASNVDGGKSAVLLPENSDRSAARLRSQIKKAFGISVAVIVSDSFGRPWREGLTEVAIGVAGIQPLHDYRGERDPHGYKLRATTEAVADELACAAGLVCGKLSRTPVCIVRGFSGRRGRGSARDLVRKKNDLFR